MMVYKRHTIVDGKLGWIIVDDNERIINKCPTNDELKDLPIEQYVKKTYTDRELLNFLKTFYEENGRIPVQRDFINNFEYPHYGIYRKYFGSWNNALRLVEMDINTLVEQEKLENIDHNGLLSDNKSIDLSKDIRKIRKDTIPEIKEKINRNIGYLHPCNKERLEDMKRLLFVSGNDFVYWMQENGIMKNPSDIERVKHENTIKGAKCKTGKEYRDKCAQNAGFEDYSQRCREYDHKVGRHLPKEFNEDCSSHFGGFIENIMIQTFEDPIKMPYGNPGFDWTCKRGDKIDNKCRCLMYKENTSWSGWLFPIKCNNVADWFILSCWDNRESLNPLHVFIFHKNDIIRGRKLHKFEMFLITNTQRKLKELERWEVTNRLSRIKDICNRLKDSDI